MAEVEEIKKLVTGYEKASKALELIERDEEIDSLLELANITAIQRMGFTDHGKVHSRITTLNSIRIFFLLRQAGVRPSIVKDKIGSEDDSLVVIILGSYLHDVGCGVSRDLHELTGVAIALQAIRRLLSSLYQDKAKEAKLLPHICECILCHMGQAEAFSIEAKIVEVADGMDIEKGRARIPFKVGKRDIHGFSALAIEKVKIKPGKRKPLRIEVEMSTSAGIFQVEQILLKKIRDAKFERFVELIARIKKERMEVSYL
jgi:hypothetical protein